MVCIYSLPPSSPQVELYAILNYLYPKYFTTPDKFESAFNITNNQIDPDMLLKANKLLKLFMIRRLKDEVERLMPKKIETKVRINFLPLHGALGSSHHKMSRSLTLKNSASSPSLDTLPTLLVTNLLVQGISHE